MHRLNTSNKRTFSHAVKWSTLSNWGREGISASVTFILAALLGPGDFGLIAIAMVYIAFVQMLLQSGFNDALIQRKELDPLHLDSAFWMLLLFSLLMALSSIALSKWWAGVNNQPALVAIICSLSIVIPIQGLYLVQQAIFHRELDFKSLALRDNISVFVGGGIGVGMAVAGYGVWSLVGQQISRASVALVLLWTLSKWRPRVRFSFAHVKDLLGYSFKVFVGNLGIFLQGQSDALVMGIYFGPVAVGLYRFADRLMNMLLLILTRALQTVSLPFFSNMQDDAGKLRKGLLTCWKISALATIPSMMALVAVSDQLMAVIGERWEPAADVLKILCFIGIAKSITLFTGTYLKAVSRPGTDSLLVWALAAGNTIGYLLLGIFMTGASVDEQIVSIAALRTALFVLLYVPVNLILIVRVSGVTMGDVYRTIRPAVLSGVLIIVAVLGIYSTINLAGVRPIYGLGLVGASAIVTGVGSMLLLNEEFRRFMRDIIPKINSLARR